MIAHVSRICLLHACRDAINFQHSTSLLHDRVGKLNSDAMGMGCDMIRILVFPARELDEVSTVCIRVQRITHIDRVNQNPMLAAIVLTPLGEFRVAGGNEGVAAHARLGGGMCAQGLLDLTHLLVYDLVRLRLLVHGIHLRRLSPPDRGTLLHLPMVMPSRNCKAITIADGTHVGSSCYTSYLVHKRKKKENVAEMIGLRLL